VLVIRRLIPAVAAVLAALTLTGSAAYAALSGNTTPRRTVSLDGVWDFHIDGEAGWRPANVPECWQAEFPDLRGYAGGAEYRKTITIPADWKGDPWVIFGAVDYTARLTVNGRYVGIHEGGYTPAAFNLADYVKPGDQATLLLAVQDAGPGKDVDGLTFGEIPHGKQSWYGNCSGPWQSVTLEERARTHVKLLKVTPSVATSSVRLDVTLSQTPPDASGTLLATVYAPDSSYPVAQMKAPLSASLRYALNAQIPQPALWSPASPKLYTVNLSVVTDGGATVDQYASRFGFRTIETRDGHILLNGRPIFLAGVLDQDFFPVTHYTVPSETFLRQQFAQSKKMGLNLLRCHIKVPDPLYLRLADEMGFIVWYEVPNVDGLTPRSRARISDTLREAMDRDFNHPSLCIVSVMNESWGINLGVPEQRKWLITAYDYVHKLNPNVLVDDNSACGGNFHVRTDITDFHAYYSIPPHAKGFADWIRELASRPKWLYSPYGDAVTSYNEPIILSEFGNWGMPAVDTLRACEGGEDPWWFATGAGPTNPKGADERFARQGLDTVFGDYGRFARATQERQLLAFKYQVEELRKYPSVCGYVWTELTDCQWESNGLMDFCRNPKASARAVPIVSQPRCAFLRTNTHNIRSGQQTALDVWLSNFGDALPAGTTVEWQLEGFPDVRGVMTAAEAMDTVSAVNAGSCTFAAPPVSAPRSSRVTVRWKNGAEVLATNYEDINLFPAGDSLRLGFSVYLDQSLSQKDRVAAWIQARGGRVAGALLGADLAITSTLTPALRTWTAQGGRTILLAETPAALGRAAIGLRTVPATDCGRGGDWSSSFMWFAKSPANANAPMRTPISDWGFEKLDPDVLIDGVDEASTWNDVEAGIFVGWVQNPAAVTLRAGNGNARLIITCLPLGRTVGSDPMADLLLGNLISEISAQAFNVQGQWDMSVTGPETPLVQDARDGGVEWAYTTQDPGPGWERPDFDDSAWKRGRGGFGSAGTPGARIGTDWTGVNTIWLRWKGNLPVKPTRAVLSVHHDEDAEVFLNGASLWKESGYSADYKTVMLSPEQIALLKPGPVALAVRCTNTGGGQFVDAGVYYDTQPPATR